MIDFYLIRTANGQKVAIVLEELGLAYRVHELKSGDPFKDSPEYRAIHPQGKLPAIVDTEGPDGKPITVFQSLAIGLYLAEKTGRLLPTDPRARTEAYIYAAVTATDLTPNLAVQYFTTLRAKSDVSEATGFVVSEAKRALHAIDLRLGAVPYLAGSEFSLADALTFPLMATSVQRLPDGFRPYANIARWFDLVGQRPGVKRGMAISR